MRKLVFFFLLLATATLRAQMIPPDRIDSIDVRVLNAKSVVVGTISELTPISNPEEGLHDLSISVKETLKGPPEKSLKLKIRAQGRGLDLYKTWFEKATPLLIDVPSQEESPWIPRSIPLDDPAMLLSTRDFKPIRDRETLLRYIRDLVRRRPGVEHVETYVLDLPNGPPGVAIRKTFGRPRLVGLRIPIDGRIERQALEKLRSKDIQVRLEGIEALRYFKSPANIVRLKALLKDSSYRMSRSPVDTFGIETRHYLLREGAYKILKGEWNSDVAQPVIEESISQLATVPELRFNGPFQPEFLTAIRQAKSLRKLEFSVWYQEGPNGTPGDFLDVVAGVPSLTELILPQLGLEDAALPALERLPHLQRLVLDGNPISDAGLKTLARLKGLKTLEVGQTDVTDAGLAALRKARPDLRVLPERATSPLGLYVRRNDLVGVRRILDRRPEAVNDEHPLHWAAYQRHYEMVKLLLARGASPEATDEEGFSALHSAMRYFEPDLRIVELLIAHGANVNRPTPDGISPLLRAFQNSNPGLMRLFLSAGADPFSAQWERLGLARPRQDVADLMDGFTALRVHPVPIIPRADVRCDRVAYALSADKPLTDWTTTTHGPLNGPLTWSRAPSGRAMVGPMGQQSATFKVAGLPSHRHVRVEIELFLMGSWDGNGGLVSAPDVFDIRVPGVGTLLHSTFSNNDEDDAAGLPMQSFPDPYPLGFHKAYAGALEVRNLGHTQIWQGREYRRDAVYKLVFTFAHTLPDLDLLLDSLSVAEGEGTLADSESWGIGGVVVKTDG
ncbi:hypothetical protein EON79_03525 [bacterium]|nr:MAG: hypothetical protein EON79_03525 [bacterium]